MLAAAQTVDVLTKLRNDYQQDGNILRENIFSELKN
jgi:hypothetical protein